MLRYRPRVGGISRVCSPRRTAACVRSRRGISWTASSCVWRSPRGRSRHHVHTCCHRSGSSQRRNCRNAYAPPWTVPSRALLRRDRVEGGPALFYFVAAAVRAGDLCLLMRTNGQNLRKHFLARMAEELVVGHTDLPRPKG